LHSSLIKQASQSIFGGYKPVVSTSRLMKHPVLKAESCASIQACVNSLISYGLLAVNFSSLSFKAVLKPAA